MNRNGYVFDFEGFRVYVAGDLIHPKTLIPYHYSDTDLSGLPGLLEGMEVKIFESLR